MYNIVFDDAGEREIRSVILYANTSKLYVDEDHTQEVDHDVALDFCMKQEVLIYDTEKYYRPTSFSDSAGTLTVNYGSEQSATVSPSA